MPSAVSILQCQSIDDTTKNTRCTLANSTEVVILFFRTFSHHIGTLAAKFDGKVVFSNDLHLSELMPFLSRTVTCGKWHGEWVMQCQVDVVYELPVVYSHVHIGQAGRCFRERKGTQIQTEYEKQNCQLIAFETVARIHQLLVQLGFFSDFR